MWHEKSAIRGMDATGAVPAVAARFPDLALRLYRFRHHRFA
jgi:hypothetical protein